MHDHALLRLYSYFLGLSKQNHWTPTMNRFLTWLGSKLFPQKAESESVLHQTTRRSNAAAKPASAKAPESDLVHFESELGGRIDDGGPGKNVLIRNKYVREDTGTHDTLKIIDHSLLGDEEENGADPYNTGRFDRSQSWNLRTKK